MNPSIGIFGGSFNPPHVAHVLTASYVLSSLPLDELWVIPTFEHPFGKGEHAAFHHRLAMTKLAMTTVVPVRVLDIEASLKTPSRTINTVEFLKGRQPEAEFRLIVGSDLLAEVDQWERWDEIVQKTRPCIVPRSGFPKEPIPDGCGALPLSLPRVSSSELRRTLGGNAEPGHDRDEAVLGAIPYRVLKYIREHALYQ